LESLKILFVAAEAAPLAKVGGLGDVAGALPAALRSLEAGLDVHLVLPYYPLIKDFRIKATPIASFEIAHQQGAMVSEVYHTKLNGVDTYLINGPPVARSEAVYSGNNQLDGTKFTFFSLAALRMCKILKWKPDILHAHDWHTAPAVYHLHLIKDRDQFFQNTNSLLTVHNLPYLGHDTESVLAAFGLPRAHMSPLPKWAAGLPLPLGLLSADKISTVSQGYAQEMLTPEFGANLEEFLKTRQADLVGILNGLDQELWDPESDPNLSVNFDSKHLSDRIQNKLELQVELGLDRDGTIPLLAMINRMDHQKGVDLLPDALRKIADLNWQVVILGTGDPELERQAQQLALDFPQVNSVLRYDGALASRIYGGSDLIIIPSRYEPCGLTQMISMRYGCIPLARATGGLKDTIVDYHHGSRNRSTGFLFNEPTAEDLAECLIRALDVYQDKRRWQGLQKRGMKQDFSWHRSAQKYLEVYQSMLSK
jgi:starch synthase